MNHHPKPLETHGNSGSSTSKSGTLKPFLGVRASFARAACDVPEQERTLRPFRYYAGVHQPFYKLMGFLYPAFAGYDKASGGYTVFDHDGTFIGCFGGVTLQSVRRNPFLIEDGSQKFLRALLGGLHLDGHEHHSSVCSPQNYGTLRLWQKMGLGARLDAKGKARSAFGDAQGRAVLSDLIEKVDMDAYREAREIAARRLAQVDPAAFLPVEGQGRFDPEQSISLAVSEPSMDE